MSDQTAMGNHEAVLYLSQGTATKPVYARVPYQFTGDGDVFYIRSRYVKDVLEISCRDQCHRVFKRNNMKTEADVLEWLKDKKVYRCEKPEATTQRNWRDRIKS